MWSHCCIMTNQIHRLCRNIIYANVTEEEQHT